MVFLNVLNLYPILDLKNIIKKNKNSKKNNPNKNLPRTISRSFRILRKQRLQGNHLRTQRTWTRPDKILKIKLAPDNKKINQKRNRNLRNTANNLRKFKSKCLLQRKRTFKNRNHPIKRHAPRNRPNKTKLGPRTPKMEHQRKNA